MSKLLLIVIVGPTAVGKTAIAIDIAKALNTQILSGDSRQFYREMAIGTAKPNEEELAEVPHFFVNNLSIKDSYSVGEFEKDVLDFLKSHFVNTNIAILVGGSGLYIDAVVNGLDDLPNVPETLRWQIMDEINNNGLASILQELEEKDPSYFNTVDKSNTHRICRAIEVIRHTGKPFSSFLKRDTKDRPFETIKIGITADREVLYKRINERVDEMVRLGLLEEARNLYDFKDTYALQTVGYKELFDHFEGKQTLDEAIELIKRNTRRFAKRQLTWFRRDSNTKWFLNTETQEIISYLAERIGHKEQSKY